MTSKSSPPYSPNIIQKKNVFDSFISILAVNPDLLNIASISINSILTFFTEGHLKNRYFIVVSYLAEGFRFT